MQFKNKTSWGEVKDRLEFACSTELDNQTFAMLANSAMSELNEIAFITDSSKRFRGNDILISDPVKEIVIEPSGKHAGILEKTIKLDFKYVVGYNKIDLEYTFSDSTNRPEMMNVYIEEIGNHSTTSDKVTIKWSDYKRFKGKIHIRIIGSVLRTNSKLVRSVKECAIEFPSNISSLIKVELTTSNDTVLKASPDAINSFTDDNYSGNKKTLPIYYVYGNYIHVLYSDHFNKSPKSINVYYARRMNKINHTDDFSTVYVEFENNFENVLTTLMHHKILENRNGVEDEETIAKYKRYQTLKREYIASALPKRKNYTRRGIRTRR